MTEPELTTMGTIPLGTSPALSAFETTPLDGPGMQWLEMYAQARATMKTEVVDYGNVVPRGPMPSPQMVELLYGGMRLVEPEQVPEPQPKRASSFLRHLKAIAR